MNGVVEALRMAQIQVIKENSVEITISRTEKIERDGGFAEQISTVGPFTVRIFQRNGAFVREVSTLAGTKQVDVQWGLIADYTADIRSGTNLQDEFDAYGHRFLIIGVYPQMVQGQLYGYQADLERVG